MTPDKGPWKAWHSGKRGWAVISEDFTHDVVLYVNGDFASESDKQAYCEWLVDQLNMARRLSILKELVEQSEELGLYDRPEIPT